MSDLILRCTPENYAKWHPPMPLEYDPVITESRTTGLATTIKVNGTAQNITDGVVSFEYYVPGNKTNTPTDTIAGGIISASSGTAYAIFPASANTIAGLLRVQVKYIKDGYTYRAGTFSVEVSHKGT